MIRRLAAAALLTVALVLPATALAGLPTLPLGKYSAKVKTPARLKGSWTIAFLKGGKYTITDNGLVVVRGHFTQTSQIFMSNETGPAACTQFAVYTWKRSGKTLTLKKVVDDCAGRAAVLARPFTATG
jgi:hypothetical protein